MIWLAQEIWPQSRPIRWPLPLPGRWLSRCDSRCHVRLACRVRPVSIG